MKLEAPIVEGHGISLVFVRLWGVVARPLRSEMKIGPAISKISVLLIVRSRRTQFEALKERRRWDDCR
jgi:hypothetical protein